VTNGHPTELELELARTGEADEATLRHVETCTACRGRIAFLGRVAADLGRARAPIPVPAEREAAMLSLARQDAADVRRRLDEDRRRSGRRRTLLRVVPWAAAASVALAFGALWISRTGETGESERVTATIAAAPSDASATVAMAPAAPSQPPTRSAERPPAAPAAPRVAVLGRSPADVNGDGRVDVIDAYVLARSLEGGRPAAQWDQNHDGRVDRTDVDRIAFAAVSLRSGGAK